MQGDIFECKSITLKCPSKYKDDKKQLEKTVNGEVKESGSPAVYPNPSNEGKDSGTNK